MRRSLVILLALSFAGCLGNRYFAACIYRNCTVEQRIEDTNIKIQRLTRSRTYSEISACNPPIEYAKVMCDPEGLMPVYDDYDASTGRSEKVLEGCERALSGVFICLHDRQECRPASPSFLLFMKTTDFVCS